MKTIKTPFSDLGYTVNDKFIVRDNTGDLPKTIKAGDLVRLDYDDQSSYPKFHSENGSEGDPLYPHIINIKDIEKI